MEVCKLVEAGRQATLEAESRTLFKSLSEATGVFGVSVADISVVSITLLNDGNNTVRNFSRPCSSLLIEAPLIVSAWLSNFV